MLKRKDGTPIYCACTAKAQYDETGQIMWMDGVIEDITEQKIAEVQLRMAHEELETRVLERTAQLTATNLRLQEEIAERRRLEREIAGVSHYEQQRIGQDLHDGLCQYLTGIALSGKALAQKLNIRQIPEASDALKIAELTNTALTQTRSLVRGIAPVQLEMDGLMASLDELAANTKDIFNVNCTFECSEPVLLDDNTVATQLFRVAQEAVSNAVRHGRAQNIQITLCGHAGGASLVIQDDGRGFPANDQDSKGMGLRIMECRAKMIGAVLRLEKSPLKGVRVSCLLSAPGCARDE
jgi:signal transduction histidine kinase